MTRIIGSDHPTVKIVFSVKGRLNVKQHATVYFFSQSLNSTTVFMKALIGLFVYKRCVCLCDKKAPQIQNKESKFGNVEQGVTTELYASNL